MVLLLTQSNQCDALPCQPTSAYYAAWGNVRSEEKWFADAPTGECKTYSRDCPAGQKVREGTGEAASVKLEQSYMAWKYAAEPASQPKGCAYKGSSGWSGSSTSATKTIAECAVACKDYKYFTLVREPDLCPRVHSEINCDALQWRGRVVHR